MLEIKNLTKVYKTKGGVETRALDDVSISFNTTGLVFLLGKSGSGKSTLLNLAGGLDEPTSGEIIVMGKSSKEFSGSDFDSYRNTFVGFVFQEYNVLNEFNVEDNIALALELQGKKKDREKIQSLLRDVELEAYAKRKPNTLSGGQKQRIAIARALVKDPQIIMADEPTGALDSATGKQVFDTLKQLYKTRLVIVVSHDREFAEIYGDRIVELKDGKIISDVTKSQQAPQVVSSNITKIGEDTLSVKSGSLDKATLRTIEQFLSEGEGDILISRNGKDIASFKRANRIDDENKREHFVDTPEDAVKPYEGEKAKFIRSKLPAAKAIKIGASGLRLKPFRLIITIFLSFIAFAMFGLFSTMMFYNGKSVMVESFMNSSYDYITLDKTYEVRVTSYYQDGDSYEYTNNYPTKFTPAEIKTLGGEDGFGAYRTRTSDIDNLTSASESASKPSKYYNPAINHIAAIGAEHPLRQKIYAGRYPTAADEICVSKYLYDCAKNGTFYDLDEDGNIKKTKVEIQSENAWIEDHSLKIGGKALKIVGIFDSGTIPEKYNALNGDGNGNSSTSWMLENEYDMLIGYGLYSLALGTQELADELASTDSNRYSGNYFDYSTYYRFSVQFANQQSEEFYYHDSQYVKVYNPTAPSSQQRPVVRTDGGTGALKDDELILNIQIYAEYSHILEENKLAEWDLAHPEPQYDDFSGNWDEYYAAHEAWQAQREAVYTPFEKFRLACEIANGQGYWDETGGEYRYPSKAEKAEAITFVQQFIEENFENGPLAVKLYRDESWSSNWFPAGDYKVVGYYYDTNGDRGFYCSQSFYDAAGVNYHQEQETKYKEEADATYDVLFMPLVKNEAFLSALFAKLDVTDAVTDIVYGTQNALYRSVETANEMVNLLSTIFLWVGVGLALFAALMLFNFISVSISNKKKDIGILRAVGARGTDVFKIFFAESGIIVGICTVLALISSIVVSIVLNTVLKVQIGLDVALFVFGPLSVVLMLGVALVVALVATFLPVYLAARKKPVESIRAL